jgi:hypothetical protein
MKGSNIKVGDCEGDCSNMETKYRFEWRTEANLPFGVTKEGLPWKDFGDADNPYIKFQINVENPADKRNTIRKMAQKRAFIGATVLATGTSDLFDTKDPEDPDAGGVGHTPGQNADVKTGGDYKSLIRKRIKSQYGEADKKSKCNYCNEYHILKGQEVVGIDGPNNKLVFGAEPCLARKWQEEHPAAEPSDENQQPEGKAADSPAGDHGQPSGSAPKDPSTTIDKDQAAKIFAAITAAKKAAKDFIAFMAQFDGMYEGKGVNDILASDFERLMSAWEKAVKAGAV